MYINQTNIGEHQTINNNEIRKAFFNHPDDVPRKVNLTEKGKWEFKKAVSGKEQEKYKTEFVNSIFFTVILTGIGFLADLNQLFPSVKLWFIFLSAASLFILLYFISIRSLNFKILMQEGLTKERSPHFSGEKFIAIDDENDYIFASVRGKCTYPGCDGEIVVQDRPQRYNGDYTCFAQCSVAGRQHSYGVDCNMVATPMKVDWRDLPPQR